VLLMLLSIAVHAIWLCEQPLGSSDTSKAATEAVKKLQMELGVSAGGSRDKNPWMIFFSISKA